MKNLYNGIRKFARDEEGATAVEYGIMVGLIAVGIVGFVFTIGESLATMFSEISTCLANPSVANC
jgi:pilus assembly protein Flp/PilA